MGLYGPDPLIFSFRTKKISDYLHKHWREDTLPELERAFQQGDPAACSFAAGYMLHQMLDDVVHPRIYRWMEEGSSHFRLEVALDMLILQEKKCLNPPKMLTEGKHRTALAGSQLIHPASQRQYLSGLWRMSMLTEYFRHGGMRENKKVRMREVAQAKELRDRMEEATKAAAEELTRRMDSALSGQLEEREPHLIRLDRLETGKPKKLYLPGEREAK